MEECKLFLTEKEVAARLGLDSKTLCGWRQHDNNPIPFVRVSERCVRYRIQDVEDYINKCMRHTCTKEYS